MNLLSIMYVARDMVDKGWTQGRWYYKQGENEFVCMEGAIQQSIKMAIANEASLTLCAELNALTPARRVKIVNVLARSLMRGREVLRGLDSMIAVLEERCDKDGVAAVEFEFAEVTK